MNMLNKIFTNIIKSKTTITFLVFFFVGISYQFLILPGLTVANTIINIISAIFSVSTAMFVVFYIRFMYFNDEPFELFTPDPNKTPETELDYNPKKVTRKERKPKTTTKNKKQNK